MQKKSQGIHLISWLPRNINWKNEYWNPVQAIIACLGLPAEGGGFPVW